MGTHIRESLLRVILKFIRAKDHRQPDFKRLGTQSIKRILVISCTAIGDTLFSTPAFRSLRLTYPNAHISLLLNKNYIQLFSNNPDINEIISYAGGYKNFFQLALKLRRNEFDIALVLHGNEPQATPLAYLSGADFRFKIPNDNQFSFLLTNTQPKKTWADFPHCLDQRLAIAALAGGSSTSRKMTIIIDDKTINAFKARLNEKITSSKSLLIGFQVGASTTSRRWAADRFVELGKRLLLIYPEALIVITGSPAERTLAEKICGAVNSPRIWNSAGELPLIELPALMKNLDVLVTGDTGPMHMAIATETPIVGLFAVSNWQDSGPVDDLHNHRIIQKWRTCTPCLDKRCAYAEPLCMENISVGEVEAAVMSSLGEVFKINSDKNNF